MARSAAMKCYDFVECGQFWVNTIPDFRFPRGIPLPPYAHMTESRPTFKWVQQHTFGRVLCWFSDVSVSSRSSLFGDTAVASRRACACTADEASTVPCPDAVPPHLFVCYGGLQVVLQRFPVVAHVASAFFYDKVSLFPSSHFIPLYVQEFQEEAALWEERLTKLNAVLDAWVDVQRRWLYLEGIFFASRDIKQQLPSEFAVRCVWPPGLAKLGLNGCMHSCV